MRKNILKSFVFGLACLAGALTLAAESCTTQSEMSPADQASMRQTAQQFSQQALAGNSQALQSGSISMLASNFAGVEAGVKDVSAKAAGASPSTDFVYLLDASEAKDTLPEAQFFCGLFNAPVHVTFTIPNLPPGKYGLAISNLQGGKEPFQITYVLQNVGGAWKLAGFFPKDIQAGGHDGLYYWKAARTAKSQGKTHAAYFEYMIAADLLTPVPFLSSPNEEKLLNEEQAAQPSDVPTDKPVDFAFNGKTYQVTQMFTAPTDKGMALVIKYAVPSVSDTQNAFQDNVNVIQGLVDKYPELRPDFASVVARATPPQGADYGTELPMKDIK